MKIKGLLQLMRLQSSSATVLICITGFLIAGGKLFSFTPFFLGVWSLLCHISGMIMNETEDIKHDLKAGKTFKPLISGEISIQVANRLLLALFVTESIIGGFLCNNYLALFWLFFSLFSILVYNWLSKTFFKIFLLGNIWLGSIFFAYFLQASKINPLVILFSFNVWFMFTVDAVYSGQYKDPKDKANILKILGAIHEEKLFLPSLKTRLFVWLVTTTKILLGIFMFMIVGKLESFYFFPLTFSSVFLIYETYKISKADLKFNRKKATRTSTLYEVATACVLASSLIALFDSIWVFLSVMFVPVVMLILLNRVAWGRWSFGPDV